MTNILSEIILATLILLIVVNTNSMNNNKDKKYYISTALIIHYTDYYDLKDGCVVFKELDRNITICGNFTISKNR